MNFFNSTFVLVTYDEKRCIFMSLPCNGTHGLKNGVLLLANGKDCICLSDQTPLNNIIIDNNNKKILDILDVSN